MGDKPPPFVTRKSLARTPPGGTPARPASASTQNPKEGSSIMAEKRPLTSPDQPQPMAQRQKIEKDKKKGGAVAPVAGILTSEPTRQVMEEELEDSEEEFNASKASPLEIIEHTRAAIKTIMGIVAGPGSKLNKSEINKVSATGQDLIAMVAAMEVHVMEAQLALCRAERDRSYAEAKLAHQEAARTPAGDGDHPPAAGQSFASVLRMPKGVAALPIPEKSGPVLAFYPAGEQEHLKTADDTKAELKKNINPSEINIQVAKFRKIGNAGVVVQTTSQESAQKLKTAAPPTLRVTEPKQRLPLVALRGFEDDVKNEELLPALHDQNFGGDEKWTLEELEKNCKVAFKKSWRGSRRTTVVLQCSPALRDTLTARRRLYIGWDVVEPCDFVDVTCCQKCQQFGHPAKYCRAKEATCGKCGEEGHAKEDCTSDVVCCATCKKFGKPGAKSHATMAKTCPARVYAEERAVNTTQYGE